jgi:mannose-1-phosphate guanylyltransferase
MSRVRTPKHLLKLFSDRTLLEDAVGRLEGVVPIENVFVLTSESQLPGIRAALPKLSQDRIVAEPARRDTGPAAALATGLVRARDPDAIVALLPADAYIVDGKRFSEQLAAGFAMVGTERDEMLLTFAIRPTYPATGFGYLELGEEIAPAACGGFFRRVRRFVEKPDAATAQTYFESGKYGWNACMFMWRAGAFLAEAERHAPELAAFVRDFPAGDYSSYLAGRFPLLPRISVDYAIMEKAGRVATLLAEFDWDDVGTWAALPRHLKADGDGNAVLGAVAAVDSSNNIVVGNGRLIALCGVKDLIVVETPDAVLVCHRSAAESLKKLQPLLPKTVL